MNVARQRWTQLMPRPLWLQLTHLLNTDHAHMSPSQSPDCAITSTCHYLHSFPWRTKTLMTPASDRWSPISIIPTFRDSRVVLFFRSLWRPCALNFRAALLPQVIFCLALRYSFWLLCFDRFCQFLSSVLSRWNIDLLCFWIPFAWFCPSYFPVPLALLINFHPSNILCVAWSPWPKDTLKYL